MAANAPTVLIIDAPFYTALSAALREGAEAALKEAEATFDVIEVPGVLEIPAAMAMMLKAMAAGHYDYDGFVLLGCVIRGETTHYDIVANESARAIMDISVSSSIAIGNGIQTVENEAQAWARVKRTEKDKGGGAARAALAMIALSNQLLKAR